MACHLQPQRPETNRIFYRCSEPLRKAFSHCNVRLGALDLLGCLYRHDCQTKALQNTEELAQLVITTKTRGFSAGNMIHVRYLVAVNQSLAKINQVILYRKPTLKEPRAHKRVNGIKNAGRLLRRKAQSGKAHLLYYLVEVQMHKKSY